MRIETLPDPGNRYTLGELIGSGVCAKVYRATDTQAGNKSVAIKVQKFEGETKTAIQEEFRILRDHSKHANLLDFYGVYRKKCPAGESDEIWFVLEVSSGQAGVYSASLINGFVIVRLSALLVL